MAYGIIKVDTVTFTDGGIDKNVTLSGLVQNPTFSGNVTVTGTLSGVTVTGTTASFTSGVFTNISGGTHTITSGVFASGSAASPSISFVSDPDTGVYSPGANQVALSTNGLGRVFVNAAGQVTVKSTLPSVELRDQSTNDYLVGIGSFAAQGRLDAGRVGGTAIPLVFGTDLNEKMRITPAGLVGIGTSSPSELLHVNGGRLRIDGGADYTIGGNTYTNSLTALGSGANASSILLVSYYDGSSTRRAGLATGNSGGSLVLSTRTAGGVSNESLVIDSTGRVGIGTTSPTEMLTVGTSSAGGNIRLNSSSAGNNGLIRFYDTAGAERMQIAASTTQASILAVGIPLRFAVGGSEAARIDSSQRLLVGTSSARTDLIAGTRGGQIQLEGASANGATAIDKSSLCLTAGNNGTLGASPYVFFTRTYSDSVGGVALVANSSVLGGLYFQGTDGTDAVTAALIKAEVDGTPGANDMPGRLVFSTTADGASSPTEQLRITSDRYVRLASGTGGIQFNGDTAAANALDDYEEGTFTPTIAGTTSTGTATYTTQVGKYTKIGNTVVVTCRLDWSLHTGTGSIYIAGLPFTPAGANALGSVFCGSLTFADGITARILTGQTRVYPYSLNSGGAATLVNIVAAGGFDVTCTYYVS